MRPLHAGFAALTIVVMGAAIFTGGAAVRQGGFDAAANRSEALASVRPADAVPAAGAKAQPTSLAARSPSSAARSRTIDPEFDASSKPRSGEPERIEPREPLSKLALAMPPKPKRPDEWQGTPLFQPVAPAAGLIEAKGYSVAVSGIDIVGKDETCDAGGKSWACGIRARTAFRAFLRGRAVLCVVPPQGERDLIAAQCRIGKQDVGAWLVENGWARAAAGGPYAQAGDKARAAKIGIFGKAPDLSGLPPAPPVASAPASSSILDLSAEPATPPDPPSSALPQQPATLQVFPPAPVR